jgi:hypothetical protein
MSYDIYIGNGELVPVEYDEYETEYFRIIDGKKKFFDVEVKRLELEEAPEFPNDKLTGKGNSRHPGYSAWDEFCEEAGVYSLFFNDEDGLMKHHPGFALLKKEHIVSIKQALENWKEAHPVTIDSNGNPDIIPGFESDELESQEIVHYDYILARLIWLDFWMTWAFTNCENAGVYNH